MISTILAKLYGIIREKHIRLRLEIKGKGLKEKNGIMRYHSMGDHLITLSIVYF